MKAPGSCQEYYDNLIREDGDYPIQPSLDYDPFNVTCKFNLTSGTAQTILFHDHEQPFQFTSVPGGSDGCADPGCFKDTITYDANFDQLQERDSSTFSKIIIMQIECCRRPSPKSLISSY